MIGFAIRRFAIFATALALLGCGAPTDPIRAQVSRLEKAAEERDAGAFEEVVSSEYRDPSGLTHAEAVQMLRRYFAGYETIEIILTDIKTSRTDRAATATFNARLIGKPRAIGGLDGWLPENSSWDFEVRFAPERGEWKIYWASWTRRDAAGGGGE